MYSLRIVSGLPHYTITMRNTRRQTQNVTAPKTKPNPPQPRARSLQSSVPPELVHQVCGITDPYCASAAGSKYPDDSSTKTLPFTFHTTQTVTSGADGTGAFFLLPRVDTTGDRVQCWGTVTGDSVASGLSYNTANIATLSGASAYRIVSAGIKIKRISPNLTTSGMLFVRSIAASSADDLDLYDLNTYSASKTLDIPLIDAHDVCVVFEHSSQMPQNFYTFESGAVAGSSINGFNPVTVGFTGVPASTAIFQMEFIMHVEYVFEPNAPLALAATAPPIHNAVVTTVANSITSTGALFANEGIKMVSDTIRQKALSYLAAALGRAPNPGMKMLGYAGAKMLD